MTHNDFLINRDLINPLREFLEEAQIDTKVESEDQVPAFKLKTLRVMPEYMK